MSEGSAADAARLIAAARDIAPGVRARAAQCEAERRIPAATLAELHDTGLFAVAKPRRYGGYELGWDVFNEAVLPIAAACGSTGWVYGVIGGHPLVANRFGFRFMDEMWGANPRAVMASCRRGSGALRRVAGGFRAGGTGIFSSGCLHADWVIVGDMPVADEDKLVVFVLPIRDVTIVDSWHAMGMAGTGSHDIRFDDVFVPDHHVYNDGKPPAGGNIETPLYRSRNLGGPFTLTSTSLGIALGFLEEYVRVTGGRVTRGIKMAEQQAMQMRIGESALQIEAALALFRLTLKRLMAEAAGAPAGELHTAFAGAPLPELEQATGAYIAGAAYESIERLFRVIGANQLKLSEPMQRAFRDIACALQQPINNGDFGRTIAGRVMLGSGRH